MSITVRGVTMLVKPTRTSGLAGSGLSPRSIVHAASGTGTSVPGPPPAGRMRTRAFASTRSATATAESNSSKPSMLASVRCGRSSVHRARSAGASSGAATSLKLRAASLVRITHRPPRWSA